MTLIHESEIVTQATAKIFAIAENDPMYDQVDLNTMRDKPEMVRRFLIDLTENNKWTNESNIDVIINTLVNTILKTLKWRKKAGISEMKDSDFPVEFYNCNYISICHSKQLLLVFDVAKMIRIRKWGKAWIDFNVYECEKIVKYVLEDAKLVEERRPYIIVDCSNVSITQFDLGFILSILPIFVEHYPNIMKNIIIYEVPFFSKWLRPIAMKTLPFRVAKLITFADKSNLLNELDPEIVPVSFGGKNHTELKPIRGTNPGDLRKIGPKYGLDKSEIEKMVDEMNKVPVSN